jgi:hypothetical protein
MKTSKQMETELTENGINNRLHHRSFLQHITSDNRSASKKIIRNVDKANQGMLAMLGIEDVTAQSKVSIHPEFVAYAFHLYGLSRKLFLYIVFYELNNDTCRFVIDAAMMQRFGDFCNLFGEEEESGPSVLQALRSLVRKNTMISLENETYMLNPLIAGGANENKRRKLVDHYSLLLHKKGLDTSTHFYPRYPLTL